MSVGAPEPRRLAGSDSRTLLAAWRRLADKGLHSRAVARQLGVSEAALVASGVGSVAVALRPDLREIFEAARMLGRIKLVVRNEYAVLERPGSIGSVSSDDTTFTVHSENCELRILRDRVAAVFALRLPGPRGLRRSIELYDADGVSAAKLVLRPASDTNAFDALCERLQGDGPSGPHAASPAGPMAAACPASFPASLAAFLGAAASRQARLRLTVANRSAQLTVTSAVRRVRRSSGAPWINVLDPDLDLHLNEDRVRRLAAPSVGTILWLADDGTAAFTIEAREAELLISAACVPDAA